MNSVSLVGRLTKDPELRFTGTGKAVATFTLAVNRTFSKTDEADFFNIVTWQKTAENCANYLAKGQQVAVLGRLQSRSYENKEGRRIFVVEVVANEVEFLERRDKSGGSSSNSQSYQKNQDKPKENKSKNDIDTSDVDLDEFQAIDDDEDIPF
ncbi:single-stranded DNA-binding protein [Isachenkonia alkalipeptolytica]|uniref:Single-stranded DNA-binding protein n=1 Tax=Isachenkonia alkalipeptolytica TaxID=2565777 RepID=A0AA44BEV4_9CLOT|nr:single-stranded DNA-binding protein [Isachenkonia alkalipeptolytica]NBG89699.1 single-stranded DNA-binding protein [Isachenkonia alkalipeptolytica]